MCCNSLLLFSTHSAHRAHRSGIEESVSEGKKKKKKKGGKGEIEREREMEMKEREKVQAKYIAAVAAVSKCQAIANLCFNHI